ncbi:MAG: TfoX/Sxy family protein [Hyphomonadaceae bacterium]
MALSQDFIGYATELIAGFGKVDVKRMFGGAALSRNGVGFAILDDDTFFLKADTALGAELKRQGCKPWVYSVKKDGTVRGIAYWSLPATAADDPDEAVELVKRSFAISVQAAKDQAEEKAGSEESAGEEGGQGNGETEGQEMSDRTWREVDAYIEERLVQEDDALSAAIRDSAAAGLPAIAVSAAQGKLLHVMALSVGAKRILEVGTLGGYSAIWMARALPVAGELISLEIDPRNAEVARKNIARAKPIAKVDVKVGPALEAARPA